MQGERRAWPRPSPESLDANRQYQFGLFMLVGCDGT
jgi:hypothetical protein